MSLFLEYLWEGYEVDWNAHHLTAWLRKPGDHGITAVTFAGLIAYQIDNDGPGTVIYDIEECSVEAVVVENRERFCSDGPYESIMSITDALLSVVRKLEEGDKKAFRLFTSTGMSAWIVADSCL